MTLVHKVGFIDNFVTNTAFCIRATVFSFSSKFINVLITVFTTKNFFTGFEQVQFIAILGFESYPAIETRNVAIQRYRSTTI